MHQLRFKSDAFKDVRLVDIAREESIDPTTLNRIVNNQRNMISPEILAALYHYFEPEVPPFIAAAGKLAEQMPKQYGHLSPGMLDIIYTHLGLDIPSFLERVELEESNG